MKASLRTRGPVGQRVETSLPGTAGPSTRTEHQPNRRRWKASGRNAPCPICGRNTDDKCRWHDDLIACHQGDTFSPPAGLSKGSVLNVQGSPWAVVNLQGGFSGCAVVFKPHVDRHWFTPAARKTEARVQAVLLPTLQQLFARCRQYVQACLAMPPLEGCTLQQLQAELAHAEVTVLNLTALRGPLVRARRQAPEMNRFVRAVDHWLRLVTYQLRDLERFMRVQLGVPTAAQVAALEVQ
jgi:hypothetical protein